MDHLDDAGDAGGGLGVADVGLDRAEPQRLGVAVLAVGGEQRLRLDGVAEGGAGAVGLDGVDVGGGQAGVGEGLADDALLGGAVGRGQAVAGAVLVDGGAADHGEDGVAVAAGVGEPLQQRARPTPSAQPVPSARVGERLAAAVGGEAALAAELDERRRGGHDRDAAGQGQAHSPRRSACAARCRATSEEEQAVSTVTAGPSRPRV